MSERSFFIRLRPAGPYFFGGEQNFGYDGEEVNYRVVSRKLPQQTTLFGFMRYYLLTAAEGIFSRHPAAGGEITDKKKAGDLVGSASFSPGKPLNDFGCLKKLSPVFIYDEEGEALLPLPLSHGYSLEALPEGRNWVGEEAGALHVLKDAEGNFYSYKNDLPSGFVDSSGGQVEEKEVFITHERIGIQKSYQGKTADRAFFKQQSFALREGYSFGFYVTVTVTVNEDKELLIPTAHPVPVQMGGERSSFMMEIEEKEPPARLAFPEKYQPTGPVARMVLLSDAYLSEGLLKECCLFAVAKPVPFRFLQTSVEATKRYYNLARAAAAEEEEPPAIETATRSGRYNLLQRGSVLYIKTGKESDIQDYLKGTHPKFPDSPALRFRKIGYNYFSVIQNL